MLHGTIKAIKASAIPEIALMVILWGAFWRSKLSFLQWAHNLHFPCFWVVDLQSKLFFCVCEWTWKGLYYQNTIQGESYVLARWFKCHLWPKFSKWVKFYDLCILIWFLRVYFVKKVFQWDLHSLCKMTTSYKILDV